MYVHSMEHRAMRLLSKHYDLITVTGYKFLEIRINVGPPNYEEITLRDHRGNCRCLSKYGRASTSNDRIFTRCFEIQRQFYKCWAANQVCMLNDVTLIHLDFSFVRMIMTEMMLR